MKSFMVFILAFCSALRLYAQVINMDSLTIPLHQPIISNDSSLISGIVYDSQEQTLIGATVKIYQHGLLKGITATNADGHFALIILPGLYEIEISYPGYCTHKRTNVPTPHGREVRTNFTLVEDPVFFPDGFPYRTETERRSFIYRLFHRK